MPLFFKFKEKLFWSNAVIVQFLMRVKRRAKQRVCSIFYNFQIKFLKNNFSYIFRIDNMQPIRRQYLK